VKEVLVGNNPEEAGRLARQAGLEVGMIQNQAKRWYQEVSMVLGEALNRGHHLVAQWAE